MEDGTLKQTQWGKTERPTLQAPMIPPWTWFQTALGMGTSKVVHGDMLSLAFVCFVFPLKLIHCVGL